MLIIEHIDIIVAIDEAEPSRRCVEQERGGGKCKAGIHRDETLLSRRPIG